MQSVIKGAAHRMTTHLTRLSFLLFLSQVEPREMAGDAPPRRLPQVKHLSHHGQLPS